MTVGALKRRISSAEITDWMAYDRIKTPDSWDRHARLCHLVESLVHGEKARKLEAHLPPRYRPKPRPQTSAEIKAIIRAAGKPA